MLFIINFAPIVSGQRIQGLDAQKKVIKCWRIVGTHIAESVTADTAVATTNHCPMMTVSIVFQLFVDLQRILEILEPDIS